MKTTLPLVLLASALLLASCGGGTATPSVPQARTVAGQIKELSVSNSGTVTYTAWTGGAGKVVAAVEGQDNLVTADLVADGNFSLTLPTVDASLLTDVGFSSDLPAGCTGNLKASGATDARGTAATFRVQASKSGEIAPMAVQVSNSSVSISSGGYIYADKAAGVSGTLNCSEGNTSVAGSINLQLKAGWNQVTFTITATSQGSGTVNFATGSLPAQWVYLEGGMAQPLSQQALSRSAQAQPALKVAQALKAALFR